MKIKLFKNVKLPEKKRASDAGWDVYLPEDVIFKSKTLTIVDLGFGIKLPNHYAGLFAMRSSVCHTGMIIQMPLIDSGYLGELHLLIFNGTDQDFFFKKDSRICSLFIFPVFDEELELVEDLGTSDRNENWNGSSGQ